ncbi:hypothetical protein [Henriciella sp.]|uniref:hypothetical protein n=1 Tax=Henriciella sp. TaxID=1968823 RepID=UPI00262383BE|nr:hypothetical protein [Henriciella sp.]
MFAYIKALAATILIAEISGAFLLSFVTLILFALHIHGVIFWGVEAITAAFVVYLCTQFFSRALAYEKADGQPGTQDELQD